MCRRPRGRADPGAAGGGAKSDDAKRRRAMDRRPGRWLATLSFLTGIRPAVVIPPQPAWLPGLARTAGTFVEGAVGPEPLARGWLLSVLGSPTQAHPPRGSGNRVGCPRRSVAALSHSPPRVPSANISNP